MDDPATYMVTLTVAIKKYPYSLEDLENFINMFNNIHTPAMEITVTECKEV